MLQTILFILISGAALYNAFRQFAKIRRNILLGKPENLTDNPKTRWRNVFLVALGQKKMFKQWFPAVLHLFIYAAFVITQIELVETFIDGIFGTHRILAPFLGGLYTFAISLIEVLSVLAFVATVIFLLRRNVWKVDRLNKPELDGFPRKDANLILFGEIVLVIGIFCMNGADTILQTRLPEMYHATGFFTISGWLGHLLFGGLSADALMIVERLGWWLHLLTVLAFANYLAYSKHLHIFLAFPNTYFARLNSRGEMDNMPMIMNEVQGMMGIEVAQNDAPQADISHFGAKDVFDLSWKTVMDAYTCTECGRCTEQCPANITGKKLSPRKIMMDIRDRTEEIGANLDAKTHVVENYDDGKSLFDYVSREELHACTTCNACVEACPILINPLIPILEMRRYEILTESAGPSDWIPMFTSLENGGAVWQMPTERDAWTKE